MVQSCPGCDRRELLLWYAAGTLSGDEAALAERAVTSCPRCQKAYALETLLADAVRRAELPPEELLVLAESRGPLPARLSEEDHRIVAILREVRREQERREASWVERLRALMERGRALSGIGRLAANPAWAYLLLLLMVYPAYLGLFSRRESASPSLLSPPIALGEPARAGQVEVGRLNGKTNNVVTVFVPVHSAYRYRLRIVNAAGHTVLDVADARPFDGIGTFAVMLEAHTFPAGRYELLLDELEGAGAAEPVSRNRFPFVIE